MTREQLLTDPEQAADFVKRTQLDALAIAIGTSHGAYKFTRKPTGDILAIDRIKEIHRRIPNTHLVMHGSSSVPQDLLAIIRQYGGDMKETYGVPVEEIQEAIKHGVRKINIDTDIRLAMTGAVRKFLAENPEKFDAARMAQAGARGRQADLQAALHRVRLRRPGRQDQGRHAAGRRRQVRQGRAGASRGLIASPARRSHPRGGLFLRAQSPSSFAHHRSPPAMTTVHTSSIQSLPLLARGKVRDNYAVGDDRILMVASDRLSAFDVIMGEPIPGKGELLTQMALFWFGKLGHLCPNHLTGDAPESVVHARRGAAGQRDRSMLVKRLKPIPVEAVVRGYLAGSGWKEYQESRSRSAACRCRRA